MVNPFIKTPELREPDVISSVTSPWMWVLLVGVSVCTISVIYWGFFGTLVDNVAGTGIIMRLHGICNVTAKTNGTVDYIDIKPGSKVVPSQILGRINNPDIFFGIHKLRIELAELKNRTVLIKLGMDNLYKKRKEADAKRNKLIDDLIKLNDEGKGRYSELIKVYQSLSKEGNISKSDYYELLNKSVNNENSVTNTLITQINNLFEQQANSWQQEQEHIKLKGELFYKEQELEFAIKRNQEMTWLRSDFNGTVLELLKRSGDSVAQGENIVTLSEGIDDNDDVRLISYVPATEGKKIHAGMSAFYSPSALKAADYGYLKGVVSSVSLYPVSFESINAEIKNPGFTQTLGAMGSVMRIEVDFIPDPTTKSGFAWTSKNGKDATVENGMVGTLLINTEYRRPISYILPYFREKVFGIGKEYEQYKKPSK